MASELLAVFHLLDDQGVIHIPKSKPGWIGGSPDGFGFRHLQKQVCYNGLMGEPMTVPLTSPWYLPWKRKWVFFRQNSSNVVICYMDMEVLLYSCESCCNFYLMMAIAGSTGTDVKRALTSWMKCTLLDLTGWTQYVLNNVWCSWCGGWVTY